MEMYRSGRNENDSKNSWLSHSLISVNPLVYWVFSDFFVVFLKLFLAVFYHFCNFRFFKFIWRCIEAVITRTTRNIVGSVTHHSLKLRCLSAFTLCAFALSEICISQFSRNLVIWLCLYNFIWRRIEVVITGLTRNQLGSNPPRVRISPSPPRTP